VGNRRRPSVGDTGMAEETSQKKGKSSGKQQQNERRVMGVCDSLKDAGYPKHDPEQRGGTCRPLKGAGTLR